MSIPFLMFHMFLMFTLFYLEMLAIGHCFSNCLSSGDSYRDYSKNLLAGFDFMVRNTRCKKELPVDKEIFSLIHCISLLYDSLSNIYH